MDTLVTSRHIVAMNIVAFKGQFGNKQVESLKEYHDHIQTTLELHRILFRMHAFYLQLG